MDTQENNKRPKPVVLVVLDGWGINQPYTGNAISQSNTPVMNSLIAEYPSMTLRASGEAVGLPWGESGNSEVGHISLGLGRILYQDLPRINKAISDTSFYKNPALLKAIEHVRKNGSCLHLLGLVSNGCVHSSIDHLHALLVLARENNLERVYIHAILDGRDTPFNSGVNFIKGIARSISEYNIGEIATVSGRFYTMDRNNNWDRTARAYLNLTAGGGDQAEDPVEAVEASYKNKVYDEEFAPTVIMRDGKPIATVKDNDAVIFYNFRPDRARQIAQAFVLPEFDKFDRPKFLNNLLFTGFTEYEKGLPIETAFPVEKIDNSLGEVLSKAGLKQLRIAETEKYAHVTYFFNGGREEKSPGEDHILVPSPQVSNYDLKPEMSAPEVTKKILEMVNDDIYDFILVNFANADMVGHTGNIPAAKKAIETLDDCVDKLVKSVLAKGGAILITADHGNADVMFNMQTGQIDKEHTANPVPFIIVGREFAGRNFGWQNVVGSDLSLIQPQGILSDIAPTILKIMGIEKPPEMTGMSLI
ncbi:phosphoglycerate mutase (2,3-diphosphoglycerate-independent) [Candidatus Falkowbacteria bacterium RIFOXYB2_FULL_47_14]|uniref:2,3-bisphosphoglycerate-independent phosphoglycerate mutase n=1 Tax=Candidatus Falkowbacteria bacterium RIFOXYA2_FULL_47_19 TaxID=1797994 RepID=A0A1F5SIN3_9BACT|nr:MAG: phosphoglycerate mutase (2,3-diphosphoglycerate-independent) [Candidatus Falkowbacteria bacterium RIFOXYA2_FULL_47_19]OGF36096.1 MAG: phosphoglycerate mutase (2,3-diphosphoglycerate-independent) [Candidatus Falkowbacteria bacterium RIFOXYC2_FULL_46_15]OGF44078.1 MAG: phosphoglycerate mutase (2,3-diphosphoglycerate-independent) [Candidatus Falkowbacteria bacterium RIFOXYB2_FULL_47_14]